MTDIELAPVERDGTDSMSKILASLDEEGIAKRSAAIAKTKRWLHKRKNLNVEPDDRNTQEIALDNLRQHCDENGWSLSFSEDTQILIVKRDRLAAKATMMYEDSGVQECFIMRQCLSIDDVKAALTEGFLFDRPSDSQPVLSASEEEVDDMYEEVIECGALNQWGIQGDENDPDKLLLGKESDLVTVQWTEEGRLRASIGYRVSSLLPVFDLVKDFGTEGDNADIN